MASGVSAAVARELYAEGEEGPIFGPIDFVIPAGGLTVISGPPGTGRTSLALALSGRIAPTSGDVEILGRTERKEVRRHVALAGVPQVDELERSVRVRDVVTESKAWAAPWYSRVRKADENDLAALCGEVYGDRETPDLDAYVSEMLPLDDLLLRICFALRPAHKTSPGMLVVDDLEQLADIDDQREMASILARLAEDMPVVVTTVNPPDDGAPPHHAIDLAAPKHGPEDGDEDAPESGRDAAASAKEDDQ